MHVAVKELFVREYCNRDGKTGRVTVGTEGNKARVERIRRKFFLIKFFSLRGNT